VKTLDTEAKPMMRGSAPTGSEQLVQNERRRQQTTAAMAFFDSEIVQDEAKRLFGDYQQLMQLGSEYGKFDRDGKKLYIERMEEMMERYRVFMKRFELSDDFQAKLTVEQLRTQLGNFGLTPEQMFEQMRHTLARMKTELNQSP
jgi:outer membrane receptor for Fe3+-dicitrate